MEFGQAALLGTLRAWP